MRCLPQRTQRITRGEETNTSITCDHNCGASAANFREIASSGHSDVELRTLAANDWTIGIGFVQCALQLAASRAAAVTSLAKLTRLAGWRQHARSNKCWSVDNLFIALQQPCQWFAVAAPVNACLGRSARSDAHRSD